MVRPYLDLLFPPPTGPAFGHGTAELAHAHVDPTREPVCVGKIDWPTAGCFQAEDRIRDKLVTGVQTCALPISSPASRSSSRPRTRPAPRSSSRPTAPP